MRSILYGLLGTLFAIGLLAYCTNADAATASWQNDNAPDLNGTKIYRAPGACANPGAFATIATFPKEATSGQVPNPTVDGKHCHKATHFDTANNESVFSNTAEFDYNTVPPGAPQGLSVKP